MSLDPRIERILHKVEKPGRYTGGEINQVVKRPADVAVRLALLFPDQYDIGMSYQGFKILYERVNRRQQWWAERAFCPWLDMEREMRAAGAPLWAHESHDPLAKFDVIGTSLQHEMNYTNLLNALDLSGLSPWSALRGSVFPLVVAGGEGALAAETLAPFIDVFVTGDGEEVLDDLMLAVEEFKREMRAEGHDLASLHPAGPFAPGQWISDDRQGWSANFDIPIPNKLKHRLLRRIAGIQGCYVPAFYHFEWKADGTLEGMYPTEPDVPSFIKKRQFDISTDPGTVRQVIPNVRVVHDRIAIEIKRGCNCGCRFCAAGMINRPLRERTPEHILDIAREAVRNTGYRDISLMSLSSADYTALPTAMRLLQEEFGANTMGLSLPSLRINAFDVEIASIIAQGGKSGFTFAPEAGTERLRRVINKAVDEERFRTTITQVLERGWRTLKFYFMIGLPTETDEDLQGIVDLTKYAEEEGRRIAGRNFSLAITLSPFVPKPHTPFQWHAQPDVDELFRRVEYVRSRARSKFVQVRAHNFQGSFVEGILARADRKVAAVVHRAWQRGAKFDSWDEGFNFESWMLACEDVGIDPTFYANRERGRTELLPWDHLDPSLGKPFLLRELDKSRREGETPDCALVRCVKCDVCDTKVRNILAKHESILKREIELDNAALGEVDEMTLVGGAGVRNDAQGPDEPDVVTSEELRRLQQVQPLKDVPENQAVQRVRFVFTKTGDLRWLAHLDLIKLVEMAVLRSGLPVSYTEGFNPRPRLHFGPSLSVGVAGERELFEVQLCRWEDPRNALAKLAAINSPGLEFVEAEEVPLHGKAISALAESAQYRVELVEPDTIEESKVAAKLAEFAAAETLTIQIRRGAKVKTRDIKSGVQQITMLPGPKPGLPVFQMQVSLRDGEFLDPVLALRQLLGDILSEDAVPRLTRESINLSSIPESVTT
jgi:radical SAM-linked protein